MAGVSSISHPCFHLTVVSSKENSRTHTNILNFFWSTPIFNLFPSCAPPSPIHLLNFMLNTFKTGGLSVFGHPPLLCLVCSSNVWKRSQEDEALFKSSLHVMQHLALSNCTSPNRLSELYEKCIKCRSLTSQPRITGLHTVEGISELHCLFGLSLLQFTLIISARIRRLLRHRHGYNCWSWCGWSAAETLCRTANVLISLRIHLMILFFNRLIARA